MIHFACATCAMKFQVKDEFAGRTTKCPTCKKPLVVPQAAVTQTHISAGAMATLPSVLDRAGVACELTNC